MYGNKRITPVYGDYRPRERRWNNIKIHGWHNEERTGDTAVEWDDTYNDYVGGYVHGQSEQVQTVQGKNHWRPNVKFPYTQAGCTIDYDPIAQEYILNGECSPTYLRIFNGAWYNYKAGDKVSIKLELVSGIIVVDETRTGKLSAGAYNDLDGVTSWVGGGLFVSNAKPIATQTQTLKRDGMTYAMLWVHQRQKFINARIRIMHELSSVSSPWEPFTPNSPSPDYPAPIASAQPVVMARGRNLFDTKGWYDWLRTFTTTYVSKAVVDGVNCIYYRPEITYNQPWMLNKFKPNTQYTIKYRAKGIVGPGTSTGFRLYYTDGTNSLKYVRNEAVWDWYTVISTINKTLSYIRMGYDYGQGCYIDENSIQLVEGSYTDEDIPPYTPYRPPSTVEFPELRAIALPETATKWTYIRDGVKYWADTATYVGGGWWDVVRRNFKIRWNATANRRVHTNSNETTTMIIMYESNKFGTYGSQKCFGGFESSYCSHFIFNGSAQSASSTTESYAYKWYSDPPYIMVRINNERIGALSTDDLPTRYNKIVAWEAKQAALGKPLTFGICIKEEYATTERVRLGTLASFPRYTHVEQITDGVRAHMQLNAKVVD